MKDHTQSGQGPHTHSSKILLTTCNRGPLNDPYTRSKVLYLVDQVWSRITSMKYSVSLMNRSAKDHTQSVRGLYNTHSRVLCLVDQVRQGFILQSKVMP